MRPTIALLRASVPVRLAILGGIVIGALGARCMGGEWNGSDEQVIGLMVVELGVGPVFAAMLGGTLVRGEHAPWAWGLARPIGRASFAAANVLADLALLGVASMIVGSILGDVAEGFAYDVFSRGFPVPHRLAGPLLTAIAYIGGAVGAARGHATLRALPVGLAYASAALVCAAVVVWLDRGIAKLFVLDAWPTPAKAGLLDTHGDRELVLVAELILTFATIAVGVAGGMLHALVRALARVPSPLSRRELVTALGVWIGTATLASWGLHSRLWAIADAPVLAVRGDASLVVHADPATRGLVLREADCENCFARAVDIRWHRPPEFDDVVPGRYRVCNRGLDPSRDPNETILRGGIRHYVPPLPFESCIEIELAPGRNEITTRFEFERAANVRSHVPHGYERPRRSFRGLLLVGDLAEVAFADAEAR